MTRAFPDKWAFPDDAIIPSGGHLVALRDGVNEETPRFLRARFVAP